MYKLIGRMKQVIGKLRRDTENPYMILFVLLIIFCTIPYPHQVQANEAQCENNNDWESTFCRIKEIGKITKKITNWYSDISGTINTVTEIGKVLGLIKDEGLDAHFQALHEHLDDIGEAVIWYMSRHAAEERHNEVLGMVYEAEALAKAQPPRPFTSETDGVADSRTATLDAGEATAFLRYHKESVTDGEWKKIIPDRPGTSLYQETPQATSKTRLRLATRRPSSDGTDCASPPNHCRP